MTSAAARRATPETQVLIVGAGPTGLVLALWLTKSDVRVRVIDKADGPGTTSRAIIMHARNLEFYAQLGIAQAAIDRGSKVTAANLWVRGKQVARVPFGDLGVGLSPYPYMLIFPQDEHEQMLVDELNRVGVKVEYATEFASFEDTGDGICAHLRNGRGSDTSCRATYLAGCDGAHSAVRRRLSVDFPGGTYSDLFYVADIEADGTVLNGEIHAAIDDTDFLALFPMKGHGRVRLVGDIYQEPASTRELGWDDVSRRIVERLGIRVHRVRWFSTYRVHHRVAGVFRRGRAFLLGDAAHIHSPVGGQGMNTGIGDAVNLAWKLAAVLHGSAKEDVLDTYEPERISFARTLVKTTDRGFQFVTARGYFAKCVRLTLVPWLVPLLLRMSAMRRFLFRTLSQTALKYPQSVLSTGVAGKVRGGDRLPWIRFANARAGVDDNFASLSSRDWLVHSYGKASPNLRAACEARAIPLHVFGWEPSMRAAGLKKNAVYVIRPDGHVGLAKRAGALAVLKRYFNEHDIRGQALMPQGRHPRY